nr:pikachurin [Hymenolepis microstoma]
MGCYHFYLSIILLLHLISANDEDEAALTMEIEIENPSESKGEQVIPKFSLEENCLLGRSCESGGICKDTVTLPDQSIASGVCVCPLGYSGTFCDQKSVQARFPEIQDGGYLAFGGWLFPKTGPFSVSLQIKPHVLRPRTLLFFYYSVSRAQAFYMELNKEILQLRIYNKSIEGYFYLSRLLQHSTKIRITNKNFFDISFGLRGMNEFYLSLDRNEVTGVLETVSSEEGFGLLINSFSRENAIFIGGHSSLTNGQPFPIVSAAENSLIGCVGNIVINGHLCDPRQSSFVGDAVSGYGIIDCSRNNCDNHLCESDATCKPVSATDYICQCPLGTSPPWCKRDQVPIIPEFLGNSYLALKGYEDTSFSETLLEITFLPKEQTGQLIYSGFSFDKRGDFISISLVNGQLVVGFDLGSGPASMHSSQNVTLNTWQTVRVKRSGRSFDVYLNGKHISGGLTSFTQGNLVQLTIADDLLVGGHPDPDRISALLPKYDDLVSYKLVKGFVGCVQSLIINGQRVNLSDDPIESINVVNCKEHDCAKGSSPHENEIEVLVDGKSVIGIDLERFGNYDYNQIAFYIGGAPQSLIDKFDFLREVISEIEFVRTTGGFVGCIKDIRIKDLPVNLSDATKAQNIDEC